jgi:hypothetical protein
LRFLYGPHGKPSLEGTTAEAAAFSFNVSHSGDFALVAIAGAGSLGVDVEAHREVEDRRPWGFASARAGDVALLRYGADFAAHAAETMVRAMGPPCADGDTT